MALVLLACCCHHGSEDKAVLQDVMDAENLVCNSHGKPQVPSFPQFQTLQAGFNTSAFHTKSTTWNPRAFPQVHSDVAEQAQKRQRNAPLGLWHRAKLGFSIGNSPVLALWCCGTICTLHSMLFALRLVTSASCQFFHDANAISRATKQF